MANFMQTYKNRGLIDALAGIDSDDTAPVDMSNIQTVEQLQAALQPRNEDKRKAFFQGLYDMGTAMQNRQGLGVGMMEFAKRRNEARGLSQDKFNQFQSMAALKKLLKKPLPDRRATQGTDAEGNPIKYFENVFDDGRVEKIEGTEVPMFAPQQGLTPREARSAEPKDQLTQARISQLQNSSGDDDYDMSAPWRNVSGSERDRMKARVFSNEQKRLDKIAEERAKASNLATEGQVFMSAFDRQDPSVGVQRMLPNFLAGFDDDLATMDAITSRLAPNLRAEGSGATSDFEMKGFLRGTVGRDKPRKTNEDISNAYKALSEREKERYAHFDQRLTERGHLAGADAEWQAYIEDEPLFTPEYGYNTKRRSFAEWSANRAPKPYKGADRRNVAVPDGVDPELWSEMTPEERSTWQ